MSKGRLHPKQPLPWHPATGIWIRPFEITGIETHQGLKLPAKGTIPGEFYKVRFQKLKKNQYSIVNLKRLTAHKNRQSPPCPHFYECGGCNWLHLSYDVTLQWKRQQIIRLAELSGISGKLVAHPVTLETPLPYRYRSIFPIREQDGNPAVGLYEANSHRVIEIESCRTAPQAFLTLLQRIKKWMISENISAYNEKKRTGILREVIIQQQLSGAGILVTLVVTRIPPDRFRSLIENLQKGIALMGLNLMINNQGGNTIIGTHVQNIFGVAELPDEIDGIKIKRQPSSFFQTNIPLAVNAFRKIRSIYEQFGIEHSLELYGGQGIISAVSGKNLKSSIVWEKNQHAIALGEWLAQENNLSQIRFYQADLQQNFSWPKKLLPASSRHLAVCVDPPRKGLSKPVLQAIADHVPYLIVYLSCNPTTFFRDAKILIGNGYQPQTFIPYDFFPYTRHCELLGVFTQKNIPG